MAKGSAAVLYQKRTVPLLMLIKIRRDFDQSNNSFYVEPEVIALCILDILGLLSNFQKVRVL